MEVDIRSDQHQRQQALLEGDILARCAPLPEVSAPHHADHRDLRYVHQARGSLRASLRQHDGRPYDRADTDTADLHLRSLRSCCRRSVYAHVASLLDLHASSRCACKLHPGLCIHASIHHLYLYGRGGARGAPQDSGGYRIKPPKKQPK